jgi:transcriptional regulator NrdR family protein
MKLFKTLSEFSYEYSIMVLIETKKGAIAMLKVVKRDGRIIDFEKMNVKTSVANSARDSEIKLTEKELELIAKAVEKTIAEVRGEDGVTSTYEIRGVVVRALKEMGYKNVAKDF